MIRSRRLPSFSLFGLTQWFFGNLYEAVVMTPNLLSETQERVEAWQAFFHLTHPAFYYVPLAPLAVATTTYLYVDARRRGAHRKELRVAAAAAGLALVLGIVIVTQINLTLFFGDPSAHADELFGLAVAWNVLNLVRVALLAVAVRARLTVFGAHAIGAASESSPDR